MNKTTLQLMSTMLGEVIAGTWKGVPVDHSLILGPIKLFPENVKYFNLENWLELETNEKGKNCGYSACAVGHACYDPRFKALGLEMAGRGIPQLRDDIGVVERWDAVSKLFGVSVDTSRILFLERNYEGYIAFGVKPGQVKSRVDELLLIGEDAFTDKYPTNETEVTE